jgi:hypothetical protein
LRRLRQRDVAHQRRGVVQQPVRGEVEIAELDTILFCRCLLCVFASVNVLG